jgi:hypothetical protein
MKTIKIVQYMRPRGKTRQQYTEVSDGAGAKFEAIAPAITPPKK